MASVFPQKLKKGDEVRIIAPSRSLKIAKKSTIKIADERFKELGLKITYGQHINVCDDFFSSPVELRIRDMHDAFLDKNVKGIFTVIGGFNSNQLLKYLDFNLIKQNPKVFCGFSDITALQNAIFAKTNLATYYGPHYLSFGEKHYFDFTLKNFKKCLMEDGEFDVLPSEEWSDDPWYQDQNKRNLIKNSGFIAINKGKAEGVIVGGNLCTLNLLQGTEYFPQLKDSILFIEDDHEVSFQTFDRDLQSLIHLPEFDGVKAVVIGRFQKESTVEESLLFKIIKSKQELEKIPVIADVDFGHTSPKITFPIGGLARIEVKEKESSIKIIKH